MKNKKTNDNLRNDITKLVYLVEKNEYKMLASDYFAIGYMAGASKLNRLFDNETLLREAIHAYDKTDAVGLLDTVGETLVDLGVIK